MFRYILLTALAATLVFGAEGKKDKESPKSDSSETVQTPFGRVKKRAPEPKPEPRPITAKPLTEVTVEGDTYTFKRQTPFGTQSWKRAKADLSADEKKLIADQEAWEEHEAESAKPEPEPAPAQKPQS
jgi:hypothetical protein